MGPITGLPIPAHAEIAIEGEMPPPEVESRLEGPFGEWPGYYTVGSKGTAEHQPVIRVKAIYYRNQPILLNMAPQWPGAPHHAARGPARLSLCPTGLPARLLTELLPSYYYYGRDDARAEGAGQGLRTSERHSLGASCRASSVWVTIGGDNGVS